MPTSPSRRAVLAALSTAAAAGLTGCSTPWGRLRVQPLGGDPVPTTPPPGPDELARRAAAAAVTAAATALGGLDPALAAPLRTALGEQLAALGEPVPPAAPSASGAPSASPSASASASGPAHDAAGEVAGLLDAAARTASSDLPEVAGGTARLLACLSAGLEVAAGWTRGAPAGPAAEDDAAGSAGAAAPSATSSPSGAGTPTAAAGSGEQGALVAALGVEEAAQYGYGVLAVRLSGAQRDTATGLLAAHARLVELLRDRLLDLGAAPPAPQPAWALPSPVPDAARALALAQQLESASAAAWADVVAASDRDRRSAAASQVARAAARWQTWRTAAGTQGLVPLPGLTGR